MNKDIFEIFLEHMELCAAEYRKTVYREKRTHLMTKFFVSCDLDQVSHRQCFLPSDWIRFFQRFILHINIFFFLFSAKYLQNFQFA